jgi:hypothetical protein
MQLLQSWKESLVIFLPKNFKLFFLVTIKAILGTFSALFYYCWLPILLYFACHFILLRDFFPVEYLQYGEMERYFALATNGFYISWMILADILKLTGFLFMPIFLAARPSVLRKGYRYFVSYWYYWGYVACMLILLNVLKVVIIVEKPISFSVFTETLLFYPFIELLKIVFFAFFILFLLDSDGSIKAAGFACWRAFKMFVYNLPGALLIGLLSFCISVAVAWPLFFLMKLALPLSIKYWLHRFIRYDIVYVIGAVIVACFMTNFYIKRLHDQSWLYFATKEKE